MTTESILAHITEYLEKIEDGSIRARTADEAYAPIATIADQVSTLWAELRADGPDYDELYRKAITIGALSIRLAKFCKAE